MKLRFVFIFFMGNDIIEFLDNTELLVVHCLVTVVKGTIILGMLRMDSSPTVFLFPRFVFVLSLLRVSYPPIFCTYLFFLSVIKFVEGFLSSNS